MLVRSRFFAPAATFVWLLFSPRQIPHTCAGMSALYAVGMLVALSIVLAVVWYKASDKMKISDLKVESNGSLTIMSAPPKTNPSKLYGKRIIVYTKSLGRIYASVCSISTITSGIDSVMITTSAGAVPATANYSFDVSDYVLISVL
jgi:hypothetical protein